MSHRGQLAFWNVLIIKAELVVMGTAARTGLPRFFMGNTAESILSQLVCSVLAVKTAGVRDAGYSGGLRALRCCYIPSTAIVLATIASVVQFTEL